MVIKRFMKIAEPLFLWPVIAMLGIFAVPPRGEAGKEAPARISVAGSTTVLPIVTRAAEKFVSDHNGEVSITVNAGGSGVGINSVGQGRVDIGMASREITARERKRFESADLRVHVAGRDAVACVISSEVYKAGIKVLSREQIRDIYLGKIRNWKELGGPDRRIVAIDKERHRGTRHVFMQYVFNDEYARAPGALLVTGSNNEEQTKIAQSDSAIGMLSFAWINDGVVGVGIRQGKEILQPTLENIHSGRYPISRNLNLVTRGNPKGWVKKFIDFVRGPQGQWIVESSGFVPVLQP